MPRRGCLRLRERVEHTRMQGAQLLWHPRSSHTWRLHNSGFGCHTEPFTWDSRSFLMGMGQGGVTSSSVRSGNQGWFGQFGAMRITEDRSSLNLHNTSGNILIGGNAYSLAAGQRDVSTSSSSGEWDREKNSGQCAFLLVANRSTSALRHALAHCFPAVSRCEEERALLVRICIFIERPAWQLLLHCPLRLFPGPGHTFLIASGSRLGAAATTADLSSLLWCGRVADDDLERDGGWNKHSRFFQKHLVVCVPKVS